MCIRDRGRPERRRGRGLPMDPVLRLWRLPADGHRDRGRANGQAPPAPHRGDRRQGPAARDPLTRRITLFCVFLPMPGTPYGAMALRYLRHMGGTASMSYG